MTDAIKPIVWDSYTADMGYQHQQGPVGGGQFRLDHPSEDGSVGVGYQLALPEGMDVLDVMNAAKDVDVDSRNYWRWHATVPFTGTEQGRFASQAMARRMIEAARTLSPPDDIEQALREAGFKKNGEFYTEGLQSWVRPARYGVLRLYVSKTDVRLKFCRRGSRYWDNLMSLMVERTGNSCTVYAVWPAFMDSLPMFVALAIAAADDADATGLTGPKKALRAKAA